MATGPGPDGSHLPIPVLHRQPVRLGPGPGKTFVRQLAGLFEAPVQQEALVGFEELQLVGLLQLLLPGQTVDH